MFKLREKIASNERDFLQFFVFDILCKLEGALKWGSQCVLAGRAANNALFFLFFEVGVTVLARVNVLAMSRNVHHGVLTQQTTVGGEKLSCKVCIALRKSTAYRSNLLEFATPNKKKKTER
jgi:hypothetical protein